MTKALRNRLIRLLNKKRIIMRFYILLTVLFTAFHCFSQEPEKLLLSGIVLNTDSVPLSNVAIVNIRTGKVMRTNTTGYFQAEIAAEDSLLVYHIAYKNRFINAKQNCRYIILEPDIKEILQVDVLDKKEKKQENLEQTMGDIKRLAPMQKLSRNELKSVQQHFVDEQGTHTKGFSPFFGPTIPIQLGKLEAKIADIKEHQIQKKLTSHYHLGKRGK